MEKFVGKCLGYRTFCTGQGPACVTQAVRCLNGSFRPFPKWVYASASVRA